MIYPIMSERRAAELVDDVEAEDLCNVTNKCVLQFLRRFSFIQDETGSEGRQPTMMEKPIGPLITQLGIGLSFVSQHLRTPEVTVM